jgi:N6-L-threonylcarbamoyladenine synthase
MIVLAIETSCDETSAALVREDADPSLRIISQVIRSQHETHKDYAGVVPELAARAHNEAIAMVVGHCLEKAKLKPFDLTAVAATVGPGLAGGLLVGSVFAQAYALGIQKPFMGINHLEGHILTPRLSHNLAFPYLALLASGGHCQFVLVKDLGNYEVLGSTRDDAAGEAFDKTAQILDLGFPGGPAVEKSAEEGGDSNAYALPHPLSKEPGCDMSFAGLKTAVRNIAQKITIQQGFLSHQHKCDLAASAQKAIVTTLERRSQNALTIALSKETHLQGLAVVGGVAANKMLAKALRGLAESFNLPFVVPPLFLCTDNGAMIGWAALERLQKSLTGSVTSIKPRWPLSELGISKI